jgi:L-lysine 2,3-aminomutase
VLPYYLHLPDEIQGTAHFFVNEVTGKSIYTEMQAQLPGYLLPRLVKEVAGQTSKQLIATQSQQPSTDPP